MKRSALLMFTLIAIFSFVSCSSDDNIISPDEQQNNSKSIIQQTLNNERNYDTQAEASIAYENLMKTFSNGKTKSIANTQYPEYYGGSYTNDQGQLTIYVSGALTKSQDNQIKLKNLVGSEDVIFIPGEYSYSYLNEIMDQIGSAAENKSPICQYLDSWRIMDFDNRISVDINKYDEEVIAEFKKTISDSPAIIFNKSQGRIETEVTLSAGQFITGNISGSSSVGYRVQRYGQDGVVMSGHACFKNDVFRVNGINVAQCEITMESGNVDAAFCSTQQYGTTPDNYIYETRNTLSTIIQQPGAGTIINKCGFMTGITNGTVQNTRVEAFATNGQLLRNLTSATYNSTGGDSGGVVYTYISSQNIRYTCGIHMGRLGSEAIFVKADEINYALGTNRY